MKTNTKKQVENHAGFLIISRQGSLKVAELQRAAVSFPRILNFHFFYLCLPIPLRSPCRKHLTNKQKPCRTPNNPLSSPFSQIQLTFNSYKTRERDLSLSCPSWTPDTPISVSLKLNLQKGWQGMPLQSTGYQIRQPLSYQPTPDPAHTAGGSDSVS
jgi:hypothetical protein